MCVSRVGYAQDITFRHISTDDGLSHISVVSLYQDEMGHIWIGTREGLNRYNGSNVQSYKLQENDPNSLFCNTILRITGNKEGKIYLLCTEGLSEYDISLDRFTTLWQDSEITAIHFSQQLYVARGKSIYKYNVATKEFEEIYSVDVEGIESISSLFVSSDNILYIGTNNGLYIQTTTGQPQKIIETSSIVSGVYQDEEQNIWVGSWNNGVFKIGKDDTVTNYLHNANDSHSISSNFVRTIYQDNEGNLWFGTFAGLDKYSTTTDKFTHYKAENKAGRLSHSSVWTIIKDKQGTLWIGTYFGGVNYFHPEYEIYNKYEHSPIESKGLSSPIVGRMIEDNHNNLWICTEGAGLNVYNRNTKKFRWYLPDPHNKNSISHNNVKAIYYDEKNELMWLGMHLGGLNKLDLRTNRFTHYRHSYNNPNSIPSDIVRDITPYKNHLLLATDNGICLFDPITGNSKSLFGNKKDKQLVKDVYDIYVDHKENLWISVTGEGVYRYNLETEELTNYKYKENEPRTLSNNNVNSIAQDSHNNIYFCTAGRGIDVFNYQDNSFTNYDSKKNGLLSDCVYTIFEASAGELLVITNLGFSRLDLQTKRFRNYNTSNGFPFSTINENALYLTKDKEVYLGSVEGMVSFYLDDLDFKPKDYNILLSKLYINNKEVLVNDNSGILSNILSETSSITLNHTHSVVDIEVTTTNHIPSNKDNLEYKLKGFSEEWAPLHRTNKITYTNLNAGNYTLEIRNIDNVHTHVASLYIEILPPFYKTIWAYLAYFILIAGICYYFIRSYNQRIRLKASLEYEQKHLLDAEKLNQSKLRFFTNISHEFRTPLTIIIGQLEHLLHKQTFSSDVYNKILNAYNNSMQMMGLISELLDFRKQEQGHMKISVTENNIVEFISENYVLFKEYAETKNINISFDKKVENLTVWYDTKQMQKVINNLISNAFKYTQEGDSISINIDTTQDECIIEIADTGIGIEDKDINSIFERFYQSEEQAATHTGTGIGLALSKGVVELHQGRLDVNSVVNEGSTFRIFLKLGKDHFDAQSISKKEASTSSTKISTKSIHQVQTENIIPIESKNGSAIKMLIVEDNEQLRDILTDIFTPFYTVICASNGKEGLEKVQTEIPDIVLSDIVMPIMTGIELCKAIKTNIDTCHIPVILLTAKTSLDHNLEGLKIGADDYIAKPFDVEILVSRCNNLINSRVMLLEVFSKQPSMTPQMLATNLLDKDFIDKASKIVEDNIADIDFSINDFAKAMGMSRTRLFTKLKVITGQTPNYFISTIRLKKAAYMLKNNPELSISEISIMTGFNTSHYFSKCFKDMYHITPSEYREDLSVL